ncbi:Gfo/Idh/MocA family protein [Halegenticoccus tardaugens]|uniref:Gfo/Idh/MocA family protein n=1 Tax=Halegenticoccus tardaugens TaxID=2071624 RepID=UPI00100A75F1|nr:Gfo/Idh/MocA family oxidoreductase [Halegenticoccus tardaugens]
MSRQHSDDLTEAYRFGVVGYGWLGGVIGGQVRDHERTRVVAVADVDPEARRRAGMELALPDAALYETYRDLFATEELDAVVVATPHAFHHEQVAAALDAELDVLCEKPLCVDPANAAKIADRVEGSDRTVMLGYQRHLNGAYRTARQHLAASSDDIVYVDAEITQPYMELFGGTWRTTPELSGGSVTYDTGNHLIDGLLWTTGLTPASVSAEMSFEDDDRRIESDAALSVTFEGGATGSVAVSGRTPRFTERIRVWTDDEEIRFNEDEVVLIDEEGNKCLPRVDREDDQNKVEVFVEALDTGEEPPATALDSFRAVALTAAAYESARTGRRVDVDPS